MKNSSLLKKPSVWRRIALAILCWVASLLAALVFAAHLWHTEEDKNAAPVPATVSAVRQNSAQTLWNEWVADLQTIGKRTRNQHVDEIVRMAETDTVVAVPTETGASFLGDPSDDAKIKIVPLTLDDKRYKLWAKFFTTEVVDGFVSEDRALVLRNDVAISPVFKGILLAHEGNHMFLFVRHPYVTQSNTEYCGEERDTHEFEEALLSGLGGAPYKAVLEKEVERMAASVPPTTHAVQMPLANTVYHAELDQIFSPALSEFERKVREMALWYHAVFLFYDRYYDGDKEAGKADFLCTWYIHTGLLQKA